MIPEGFRRCRHTRAPCSMYIEHRYIYSTCVDGFFCPGCPHTIAGMFNSKEVLAGQNYWCRPSAGMIALQDARAVRRSPSTCTVFSPRLSLSLRRQRQAKAPIVCCRKRTVPCLAIKTARTGGAFRMFHATRLQKKCFTYIQYRTPYHS